MFMTRRFEFGHSLAVTINKDLSTERQGYNSFSGESSQAMPLVF
jgi:hypothetical protein